MKGTSSSMETPRNQTEARVIQTVSRALKAQVDAGSTRDNTPSWDSLRHIEVVFSLEDELGLEFSESELLEFLSVQGIVEIVMKRHAA
jgi:acyl carrier protein